MSDEWRTRLAFSGMHPDRIRSLVDRFGTPRLVVCAIDKGAIEVSEHVVEAVAVSASDRREQLSGMNARLVLRDDPSYPTQLAMYPDAPDALFVRGLFPEEPAIAVVGSRACTSYGRRLAEDYGAAAAGAGIAVVSGLARGIDGAAHRGAVAACGAGVAVLGSGIDVMYPREHRALALDLLAAGGAIATEYPPGTIPEPWRFPPRNRIIAGLAVAVIVVEAAVTGGALITAGKALEYGITVLAVPGDVGRKTSVGCNLLIRDGAHPVLDPEDLLETLGLLLAARGTRLRPVDAGPEGASSAAR